MAIRKIIKINEKKCTGCGLCIPNCKEGALKIIDGKARLISDLFCDGLGACLGHCPEDAIKIEEREAEDYNEKKVMEIIIEQGENTIKEHLLHLLEHKESELYDQALEFLKEKDIPVPQLKVKNQMEQHSERCPGLKIHDFTRNEKSYNKAGQSQSQMRHWPVQLHLLPPTATYLKNADLLLAADCTAFTLGEFHENFLKGKALAIACPKLDSSKDIYIQKLIMMIDQGGINTITVMTMEVPCCSGLVLLTKNALEKASRKVPIKHIQISIQGEILKDIWI